MDNTSGPCVSCMTCVSGAAEGSDGSVSSGSDGVGGVADVNVGGSTSTAEGAGGGVGKAGTAVVSTLWRLSGVLLWAEGGGGGILFFRPPSAVLLGGPLTLGISVSPAVCFSFLFAWSCGGVWAGVCKTAPVLDGEALCTSDTVVSALSTSAV